MEQNNLSHCEYRAADKNNFSWKARFAFYWRYFKLHVVIFWLFIPETFRGIKNFIVPTRKSLMDKVVLITGGGNGLGRSIALRLAKEKCRLAIVDIDFVAAQETASEIERRFQVAALPFRVDISKHQEVSQLKNDVEKALGSVDILINNAGLLGIGLSLMEGTPEAIQKMIDVNLASHFWTLRTFLNGMVERKQGHIVAISSLAGKLTFPNGIAYCATKFGVTGFMDALFDELSVLGQDFIKTTTVYPFFVNTRRDLTEYLEKNQVGNLPRSDPDEVADVIVEGIKQNRRNIFVPAVARLTLALNHCPDKIIKYAKAKMLAGNLTSKGTTEPV